MKKFLAFCMTLVFALLFTQSFGATKQKDSRHPVEVVKKADSQAMILDAAFPSLTPPVCTGEVLQPPSEVEYKFMSDITATANGPPKLLTNPNALIRRL